MLHAVRDNLTIDLRSHRARLLQNAARLSGDLQLPGAATRPPRTSTAIPIFTGDGEPDLTRAALARAAGLSTVAYDTNALENQFLQGWLIQDRFMLRGVFGAPYEFLWANPYQPGLSYAHLPLTPPRRAVGIAVPPVRLGRGCGLVRSSRRAGADCSATAGSRVLSQKGPLAAKPEPIRIGKASVVVSPATRSVQSRRRPDVHHRQESPEPSMMSKWTTRN